MQKRISILILAAAIVASVVASGVASTGTVYTWEKTFEVTQPQVIAKIKISENRIVGCPILIQVRLRLNVSREENDHDCREFYPRICACNVSGDVCNLNVNGTFSANLLWHNATSGEWQQVKVLQEGTNITVTGVWQTETYTFVPISVGEYKVVAQFVVGTETQTFTNED